MIWNADFFKKKKVCLWEQPRVERKRLLVWLREFPVTWQPCDVFSSRAGKNNIPFLLFFSPAAAKSEGRPCEYNSRIYQNGESFQPNCKHQCTCIDGAVGCVPLCPQELSLPNLGCANPRLVKVAGQCCEEWVCDDGKQTDILERIFGKDMLTDELERDLTNKNELISIVNGGLKSLPGKKVLLSRNSMFLNEH